MSTLIYADTETEAWNRQGRHSTEYADEQTQQEPSMQRLIKRASTSTSTRPAHEAQVANRTVIRCPEHTYAVKD